MSKIIDWERVGIDYRAGILTVREIGEKHGVSHTAVVKRARSEGWERDLAARIAEKTKALVSKREVSKVVTAETKIKEQAKVDAIAEARADIEMRQRSDLKALRDEAMALMAELGWQRESLPDLVALREQLVLAEKTPAAAEAMRSTFDRALAVPARVASIKALTEIVTRLIPLERQVLRMDEEVIDPTAGRTFSDVELASKMAYFVHLGRQRAGAQKSGASLHGEEISPVTGAPQA